MVLSYIYIPFYVFNGYRIICPILVCSISVDVFELIEVLDTGVICHWLDGLRLSLDIYLIQRLQTVSSRPLGLYH